MAYPLKSNWGSFINPQFNRLHNQIEQQTQALLQQRNNLNNNASLSNHNIMAEQHYLKSVDSQKYIKLNSDRTNNLHQSSTSKNNISQKVKQLIDLCKSQNSVFGNQLIKVLGQQKNIYNDLINSNRNSLQKTQYFGTNNPIIQAQKQSSVINGSRSQPLSSNISSGNTPTKGFNNPTGNQFSYNNQPIKSNIRQAIQSNTKIQVGDDLISMIQEIQRKALNQIEKLRQQKIDLMKQLKHQIQSNNQLQRQINSYSQQRRQQQSQRNSQNQNQIQNQTPYKQFQSEERIINPLQEEILRQIRSQMQNLRRQNENLRVGLNNRQQTNQTPINPFTTTNPNEILSLKNRINLLQNQLRNRDQLIHALSLQVQRLNQQPSSSTNPQQISQLLEQGESIRQNTLHLIRLKQGQSQNTMNSFMQQKSSLNQQNRIQQLQQLLQRQQQQKQSFLNDLLAFKQKYQQLEEENKMLKRQSNKYNSSDLTKLSPIMDKSSSMQIVGNSLDDYERLLSQMRGNRY